MTGKFRVCQFENVSGTTNPSAMATKPPEGKCGLAAQVLRNVKPARNRKIGTVASLIDRLQLECSARRNFEGFPCWQPPPIELGFHIGSCHARKRPMMELKFR